MKKLLNRLFTKKPSERSTLDADKNGNPLTRGLKTAITALLVEMAGQDNEISSSEAEEICVLLAHEMNVPESELPALVQEAMQEKSKHGKVDAFVAQINEHLNAAQRIRLLAMVWKMIGADGKVDKNENRFAVQLKFRLMLSNEQEAEAREMASTGEV